MVWTVGLAALATFTTVTGLVALALLVLHPRHPASRAFALLLGARAVAAGSAVLRGTGVAPLDLAPVLVRLAIGLNLIFPFLALHFLLVYPAPRMRRRRLAEAALGLGALLTLVFVAPEAERIFGEVAAAGNNPLVLATYGGVCIALARDAARAPPGSSRTSMLLVVAGFALYLANTAASLATRDALHLPRFDDGLERAAYAAGEASILFVLVALWALLRPPASGDAELRRMGLGLGLFTVLAVATTAIAGAYESSPTLLIASSDAIMSALWRLALPLLVAYGLLRHRIFDIDLKVKWTIGRSTLAAAFVAAFFVVTELAQAFLTERQGFVVGGVAAGLLLFALSPLQRLAERLANAAMPHVRDTPEWRAGRKHDVYRSAVRFALADGVVTQDEERHLAELATELDISAADAYRLRAEVADAPRQA